MCAWTVPDESLPHVVLLNNFGAAGLNGALLLEEYVLKSSGKGTEVMSISAGISAHITKAVKELKVAKVAKQSSDEEIETEEDNSDDEPFGGSVEKTPLELSADATSKGTRLGDMESTMRAPSLFGDNGSAA
ncbi:hypothetical protein EDD18DRAFT_1356499 [Armillaria luteobubalina]|uniref:Uncharacterized protein n=1 Tax=Armillaria luteobubalina TaxID=153913 RepID=A0AA39PZR2_9AGAR|nr:hypothetical protein EDD18DRAFT_1356499 [Armillaria luteobubalina]